MVDVSVYVISAGDDAVKVGLATRPKERLRALQTAHYQRLSLCHAIVCGESEAAAVERRAHQILKSKRVGGEWFSVGPDEAREAIEQARQLVLAEGVPEKIKKPLQIQLREYVSKPITANWGSEHKPNILNEHDMELAKSFFIMLEKDGAIADDCRVLTYDPTDERDTLMYWWDEWNWDDALIRLEAVSIDLRKFNATRWPEHNYRYSESSGVFRFRAPEENALCVQLWHDAKLVVRETGIDALLMAMMEQGAPSPWAGLICENGRPGTRYASA